MRAVADGLRAELDQLPFSSRLKLHLSCRLEVRIEDLIAQHNHLRYHQNIDNLTPATSTSGAVTLSCCTENTNPKPSNTDACFTKLMRLQLTLNALGYPLDQHAFLFTFSDDVMPITMSPVEGKLRTNAHVVGFLIPTVQRAGNAP